MRFLLLFFVILTISTTTNTQKRYEHADSCFTSEEITVPYTLWVGTYVNQTYNIKVPVKRYTAFYNVMIAAENLSWENYRFDTTCSEYGHYVTSIGGLQENVAAHDYWLIYVLSEAPDIQNPPSSSKLSPAGVDGMRVVEGRHYLFWLRNTDFLG